MRGRGWLEESRVWKTQDDKFDKTVQLRPLHRCDLPGYLAAELPPHDGEGGQARYLVAFRVKDEWDANIPRSAVLVHRFQGNQSYVMSGTDGQLDLVEGNACAPWLDGKTFPRVEVVGIDENDKAATVRLIFEKAP
jgi:hypothetical protein